MNRFVGLAVAVLTILLLSVWTPTRAAAIPPGPWVLPASDLSSVQPATYPQIAFGPDGSATAVWLYQGQGIQAATRPPGGSFGTPQDLVAVGFNAQTPQVGIGADGTTVAVWSRSNGSNYVIEAATRPPGGSFGPPESLSAAGQTANQPQVAVGPDGTTIVIWGRFNGSNNIIQATVRPPGGNFGTPVDLSAVGASADGPQIAILPDGSATAVWGRGMNAAARIQASTRPAGGTFGPSTDLSDPGLGAFGPQIGVAADGETTVSWSGHHGGIWTIRAAIRPPGGSFGSPIDISGTDQGWFADVAVTPDGGTSIDWSGYDPVTNKAVVRAAVRPPGGSFAPPADLTAPDQDVQANTVRVGAAPDGTSTAIWSRSDGSNDIVQTSTRPPSGSFGPPVDLSAPGQNAESPQIAFAPDDTGIGTAIWSRHDGGKFVTQAASTTTPNLHLTVGRAGNGEGSVTSGLGGIDCGAVCTSDLPAYTEVTLTANPGGGSAFSGWSGACTGTQPDCLIRMDQARNVTATFVATTRQLTVSRTGSGQGLVTSNAGGIGCGTVCAAALPAGSEVTLTAMPAEGSVFSGWTGDCSGSATTCVLRMDDPRSVTATFTAITKPPDPCRAATMKLGRVSLNRRRGTARITATIGAPGRLTIRGTRLVRATSRSARRAGRLKLNIRTRGRALRQLRRRGSTRVRVDVTFRPGSGCPGRSRTRTVRLIRRR
ncbi:MAG: hypothetical protein M9938_03595 [Solirubrobacterales bacterium]|nr:hypothetical protein [Solirubrobacterales bacterium]